MSNKECEQYGELISGLVDGELDRNETEQVNSHLAVCSSCQKTLADFELVDMVLQEPGSGKYATVAVVDPESTRSLRSNRSIWFAIGLTTAAMLLVGLTIFWPNGKSEVDPVTNIQAPAIEFSSYQAINQKTIDSGDDLLKTMELQLRLMRMKVNQLDSTNPAQAKLKAGIEKLIEEVQKSHLGAVATH